MNRILAFALLLALASCGTYTPLTPGQFQAAMDRGNGCFNAINCDVGR